MHCVCVLDKLTCVSAGQTVQELSCAFGHTGMARMDAVALCLCVYGLSQGTAG